MWFNLKNVFELETFRKKVAELENKGAMVELKEKRGRSLKQNAYLHLLLSAFGLQLGYFFPKRFKFKHIFQVEPHKR